MTGDCAVILAAGCNGRWKGTVPKVLLPTESGQPLVVRTAGMCRDRGVDPIVMVREDLPLEYLGLRTKAAVDTWATLITLRQSRGEWTGDRVVILLGDTLYSNRSMDVLFGDGDDLLFLGTGSEIYGLRFDSWRIPFVLAAVGCLEDYWRPKNMPEMCRLWNLYRHLHGLSQIKHTAPSDHFHIVTDGDETMDFDHFETWESWIKRFPNESPA